MKSELDQIIEYYETEKINLELMINESLKEWEYKSAHYHFRALCLVNKKILTLKSLKDPFYYSKNNLLSTKESYEKMKSEIKIEGMQSYYDEQISAIEKKLDKLAKIKYVPISKGHELDDHIKAVSENKITGFLFHLIKVENLYLEFRLMENSALLISFTPFENLGEFSTIQSDSKKLKAMGFYINEKKGCLEIRLDLKSSSSTSEIKTLISRILFDVYHLHGFDKPTVIEVIK